MCNYSELFFLLYIFLTNLVFLHSILHAYVFIPDRQQTIYTPVILTPLIYLSMGSMLFVSNLLSSCSFYTYSFLFIFLIHQFLQAFPSPKKFRINQCDLQTVVHKNASPLTPLQIAHKIWNVGPVKSWVIFTDLECSQVKGLF